MPRSRITLLREAISELIDRMMQDRMPISKGMGEVYDEAIRLGITTETEVFSLFGKSGFIRDVVHFAFRERDEHGRLKRGYNPKEGRYFDRQMALLDDLVFSYCHKFNNASSVMTELKRDYEEGVEAYGDKFADRVPHYEDSGSGLKVQIPDDDEDAA